MRCLPIRALYPFKRYYSTLPTTIKHLLRDADPLAAQDDVRVSGWIKSIRHQKRVAFAEVTDGSGSVQVVMPPEKAADLTTGCSITVNGALEQSRGSGQALEIKAREVSLLGRCEEAYPIQKKAHTAQYLRKYPHLRNRTESIASMLKYRHDARRAVSEYLSNLNFISVEPPILTSSDCEGGSSVFQVESSASFSTSTSPSPSSTTSPKKPQPFFDSPTYLTVSSQLYLEALSASLGRVYTLSPAFRAEQSATSRHLTEFIMLELEISFISDLNPLLDLVEGCVKSIVLSCGSTLPSSYFDKEWPRITYSEAIETLREKKGTRIEWGDDLNTEQEKWLAERHFQSPLFVTRYPKKRKPFYMRQVLPSEAEEGKETVDCFDLLVPRIGELAGGSLREERLIGLESNMREKGLTQEDYEWYLDLRRFGSVPHGGFGLGWERLISWMSGAENVRECIAFPRATEGFKI